MHHPDAYSCQVLLVLVHHNNPFSVSVLPIHQLQNDIHVLTVPENVRHESDADYLFLLVVIKIVTWRRKFSDIILTIFQAKLKFFCGATIVKFTNFLLLRCKTCTLLMKVLQDFDGISVFSSSNESQTDCKIINKTRNEDTTKTVKNLINDTQMFLSILTQY